MTLLGSVENPAPCYGFNGKFQTGYYPCQTFDVAVSQCCSPGWTCFSNAMCITTNPVVFLPNVTLGSVLRSACTDPGWNVSGCGGFCLTNDEDEDSAKIIPCGDDTFCCGYEYSRDLCDCGTGNGTFSLAPGIAQTVIGVGGPTPKGTPTLSAISVSATTSKAPIASETAPAVSEHAQSVTETVGFKMGMLAAGAVVLITVVIAIGSLCWGPPSKRNRRKRTTADQVQDDQTHQ
ncbi:hypothetical protein QBC37DRAFT_294037 [Rhypophila decipiens]|uniref:Uncharacterized protein n=1 Tax=Rhypophila decipiens TaxID=261697 RepID=A0AAN6Y004_9PEZI|nr:hypothetical protein QBC37DRAFT_294037 [Rhypophila decipiens]